MGEAREVMDRATEAYFSNDYAAAGALYAPDAVAVTPDDQTLKGPDEIVGFFRGWFEAFPDATYEDIGKHESGNVAVDEGIFRGTHTGPMATPDGGTIPPTGKRVSLRGADVATVENGRITKHHFYFDQMALMVQLGLMPEQTA